MPHFYPILADTGPWSWAIVLFCVILGVIVSLNPSRRTYEVKRTKEE